MLWLFLVGATWPLEAEPEPEPEPEPEVVFGLEVEAEAEAEVEGAGLLFVLYKVPPIFDILYGLSIVER